MMIGIHVIRGTVIANYITVTTDSETSIHTIPQVQSRVLRP